MTEPKTREVPPTDPNPPIPQPNPKGPPPAQVPVGSMRPDGRVQTHATIFADAMNHAGMSLTPDKRDL